MPSVMNCLQCEQPLPDEPPRRGAPRKYCSLGCRTAYHHRKYRLKRLEAEAAAAKSVMPDLAPDGLPLDPPIPGEEIIEPVSCMCLICAVRFDLTGFQRTCSCCRRSAARGALDAISDADLDVNGASGLGAEAATSV